MRVTVRDTKDAKGAHNRLEFWCNGKIVRVCDECDFHETVKELAQEGYVLI